MRVALSARTVLLAIAVALGAVAAWNVLHAARAVVATAVAAAVVALLLTGPVEWMRDRTGRPAAIVITLLFVVIGVGGLVWGVYDDLDRAFARLQEVAPEAARDLERSERVGEVARDLQLAERVEAAVDRIRESTQERAREAAFRAASYFVAGILTLFLLIYGPRMIDGAVNQVADDARRARVRTIVDSSLARGRRYLTGVVLQGLVATAVCFGFFRLVGLPASLALAGVVGLAAIIPYFGIVAGFVPALLLSAAFEAGTVTAALALLALGLQVASIAATRQLSRRALYTGPALTLFAVLIGWDVYGPGGAVFGTALTAIAVAVMEAASASRTEGPEGAEGAGPAAAPATA